MKTLKEISRDTFYKMGEYHQITIDLVQETEDLFSQSPEDKEEQEQLITNLNCLSYDISVSLEVFNPKLENEISDLKHLLSLIEIRIGYVESLDFKLNKQ